MTVTAGAPRSRALAAALRRARQEADFGVRELARELGVSHATISQWENAKRVPDLESVVSYLQALGVTGRQREQVMELIRGINDPSWLASGVVGQHQGLQGALECERTTNEMVEWIPLGVPGLLQTEDFARAILSHNEAMTPREIDGLVQNRLDRQRILTQNRDEGREPVEYTALIGEYVLRERIGGVAVQLAQLRHLLAIDRPNVTIRVVPAGGDWHPGLVGPFVYYGFAEAPPIVHIEHYKSSVFLYDAGDVTGFKVASTALRRRALSPAESAELIGRVINETERIE